MTEANLTTDVCSGAKILVVDDVKENLELITKFLELEGYDVSFAMDGKKAIKLATLAPPDLILLDVMMPGIDGFETCRQLKAINVTRDIPIIFVTGKNEEQDIVEGFNVGGVDYISKPIQQKELQVRVKNHLELHGLLKIRDNLIHELKLHNEQNERFLEIKSQKLIEAEKLASLGELVAQLCHEISTPIGTSITAITSSAGQVDKIKKRMDEKRLTKHDLSDLLEFEHESQTIIESNLTYAADLMTSFKQVAVDQFTENQSEIELLSYFQHILRILKPRLKKTKHQVVIDCPPDIHISTLPSALSQIFINLVTNSLVHGFKSIEQGNITFTISCENDVLTLNYQDDGVGMNEQTLAKIFEQYFTTARNEGGSGVGLYIIKEIVEKKLNGEVHCESEEGKGATFIFNMPVKRVSPTLS